MVLGLVIVAAGFFLGLFDKLRPAALACNIIGWALVLWFGLPDALAHIRAL
jgi:hypothetical protein